MSLDPWLPPFHSRHAYRNRHNYWFSLLGGWVDITPHRTKAILGLSLVGTVIQTCLVIPEISSGMG